MKKRNLGIISAVFLLIAAGIFYQIVWAFPPTPPANMASPGPIGSTTPDTGSFTTLKDTTGAGLGKVLVSDAGGNLTYIIAGTTGQVLIGANGANPAFGELTVGYVTGAAATADLAEDLSTASHLLYKNAGGNVTDVTLGNGLQDTAGTLVTVADVISFDWDGGASAVGANAQTCKYVKLGSTVTDYSVIMDLATNAEIALYKGAFNATVLPSTGMTGASNIVANSVLGIVGTNVTGWGTNTTINAGDVICANVISNDTAKKINVTLHGTR